MKLDGDEAVYFGGEKGLDSLDRISIILNTTIKTPINN
jgi:hypothetical protein